MRRKIIFIIGVFVYTLFTENNVLLSQASLIDNIGDGKEATSVVLTLVDGVAISPDGEVYISHRSKNRIRKIDKYGFIHTVAGNGIAGYSGDDGQALKASLNFPAGLAFDSSGNLFIADRNNHRIRRVDTHGIITTVAGNGIADMGGDNGLAIEANLNYPSDIVIDDKNNIFISDRSNNRIRKINPSGLIFTVVGRGMVGYGGDFGPAEKAILNHPFGIDLDSRGNLYIADRGNNRIRKVDAKGIITTICGDGYHAFGGDYGPANRASLAYPTDIAADDKGNIYIADRNNNRVRKIDSLGIITPLMGTGKTDYNGDNEISSETNLYLPLSIALDSDNRIIIVDRSHFRVRSLDLKSRKVVTLAGNGKSYFKGDHGLALGATLSSPSGIIMDRDENILFADQSHNRIRKINHNGVISTFAGNGKLGNEGNGGLAIDAALYRPTGLTLDAQGNIYVISRFPPSWNIRKIDRKGIIRHFAGNGKLDGPDIHIRATNASFRAMKEIAIDKNNNLFIANLGHINIVKNDGRVEPYFKKEWNLQGIETNPNGFAFAPDGSLYVSDSGSNKIRRIGLNGMISTIAGTGDLKNYGDNGPALKAGIRSPGGLAFSPSGELYIAQEDSHRIRKINKHGTISTFAGTGVGGFRGNNEPAFLSQLKNPYRMVFDKKGSLYFTDRDNNRIRKIDMEGTISTVAGHSNIGWMQDGLKVQITVQNFP